MVISQTHETHTCFWAFSSGAVTACVCHFRNLNTHSSACKTLFPTAMAYERSTILHTNRSIRPTLPRCGKRHQRNNRTWLEWSLGNICLYIQIQALWMWHTKTIEEQLRLLLFPSLLETNSSCMGYQYGNFQIIKILLCIK